MKLSNKAYDALKFVALVLLPGFSAAYFSLAQIWGLPNPEQVIGTATTIDTLLGLLLKASSTVYGPVSSTDTAPTDGALIVNQVDGEKFTSLGFKGTLEELLAKNHIKLEIVNNAAVTSDDK